MITQPPTKETLEGWKALWLEHKDKLQPNRKNSAELLDYLQTKYELTEFFDEKALRVISDNVTQNPHLAQKLPVGQPPAPRAFWLEKMGNGARFYSHSDHNGSKIFVGIDMTSGFYLVEGSPQLWDVLCAFQGLDQQDLQNFVCVGLYLSALAQFGSC